MRASGAAGTAGRGSGVATPASLGDALLALAAARGVDARRMCLEKPLHALLDRVLIVTGQWDPAR